MKKQSNRNSFGLIGVSALTLMMSACGGGGGTDGTDDGGLFGGGSTVGESLADPLATYSTLACTTETGDSGISPFVDNASPEYGFIQTVRLDVNANGISIDYMLHRPVGAARGLVVLIPDNPLDAEIEGSGGSVISAGTSNNDFLVRSSARFAEAGYLTVTMDAPSDIDDFYENGYDKYRQSPEFLVDLSSVINAVDTSGLATTLVSVGRGTLAAVNANSMVSSTSLLTPVTSGTNILAASRAARVPTQIVWHRDSQCADSTPFDNGTFTNDVQTGGNGAYAVETTGGSDFGTSSCSPTSYSGFNGIESCTSRAVTDWIDSASSLLVASRELLPAGSVVQATEEEALTLSFNVGGAIELAGSHSDSGFTSLGGTLSLSSDGFSVQYQPPGGVVATQDSFAYVYTKPSGEVTHQIVRINLNSSES